MVQLFDACMNHSAFKKLCFLFMSPCLGTVIELHSPADLPSFFAHNVHYIPMIIHTVLAFLCFVEVAWWRHQMETFSGLLALCAGNSPVTREFPSQMPVTRSFDIFFDVRLDKRSSTLSMRRWFETPFCSIGRHCNDVALSFKVAPLSLGQPCSHKIAP